MANTTEQMDKMAQGMAQACSEMSNVTRASMNAALQSTTVMTQGCAELCDSVSNLMQNCLTHGVNTSKAVMTARSMRELMDVQSSMMKNGLEFMLGQMTKISEISTRTAKQAAEPVAEHVTSTITKLNSKAKAAA